MYGLNETFYFDIYSDTLILINYLAAINPEGKSEAHILSWLRNLLCNLLFPVLKVDVNRLKSTTNLYLYGCHGYVNISIHNDYTNVNECERLDHTFIILPNGNSQDPIW